MKNKKWKSGEGERERKKSYWKENNKDIFKMYKLHNQTSKLILIMKFEKD